MGKETVGLKFHQLSPAERLITLVKEGLSPEQVRILQELTSMEKLNRVSENVIGSIERPLSVVRRMVINGKPVTVFMVTEEASIVAGVCKAVKLISEHGGFTAEAGKPILLGQIQIIPQALDLEAIGQVIEKSQNELVSLGNKLIPKLVERKGGVLDIRFTPIPETREGPMGSVDILLDTRDAMGASAVTRVCEGLKEEIARITGAQVIMGILSNYLPPEHVTVARCRLPVPCEGMSPEMAGKINFAQAFAESSVHRAVTHNKGVMNGVGAVALATGQDLRAIEAGVNAYAAKDGLIKPLTSWELKGGHLCGEIRIPLAVGIVGGITNFDEKVHTILEIMGVKNAGGLAEIMASVGLAQNLAALMSLVGEGIVKGHGDLNGRKK